MTSCYPETVGGGTCQEMCGMNNFLKEALWPWLIWTRESRPPHWGIALHPPTTTEILCKPPSQEDKALI